MRMKAGTTGTTHLHVPRWHAIMHRVKKSESNHRVVMWCMTLLPLLCRCLLMEGCIWDHTTTGIEYEVLAGPAFTLVFTLVALPLGMLAGLPRVNRKMAIAICLILWSSMTLLSSYTQAFWQLLLTRIGLGIL